MTRLVFRPEDKDEGSVQIQTSGFVAQLDSRPGEVGPDGGQWPVRRPRKGIFDVQRDIAAHTEHQSYQLVENKTPGKSTLVVIVGGR